MKKYLYFNPRGFANEFDVFSVEKEDMEEAKKLLDRYESDTTGEARFITRKEAEKLVAGERRNMRDNKRAGLSNNPVGATEIMPISERMI